jgi:hypothetical protein
MVGKAQKSQGARSGLYGGYSNGGSTDPLFPSPTQNSIQISLDDRAHPASYPVGTGALSPGVKRPGREADHLPLSNAEVKNTWSYTSTPPYFIALCLIKQGDNFAFSFYCTVTAHVMIVRSGPART